MQQLLSYALYVHTLAEQENHRDCGIVVIPCISKSTHIATIIGACIVITVMTVCVQALYIYGRVEAYPFYIGV